MSENPLGAELDSLITEVVQLNADITAASGSVKAALESERSAKLQALAKLDAISEDWRLSQLTPAVDALNELAASELARQAGIAPRILGILNGLGIPSSRGEGKKVSATDKLHSASNTVAPSALITPHRNITIDARAFDALSRVAQSEVGHFLKYGRDQLEGGVSAVVDTIINRVAHSGFPDTLEEVIDQRFQFSAINTLGTWELLPVAKLSIQNIVRDYLDGRVAGAKGLLEGATHFLNPHFSSANALSQWGNHVVANAVAQYGDDAKKDVHFHGFAPGTPLPRSYRIVFGDISPVFDGHGVAVDRLQSVGLRQGIIQTLEAELKLFENGKYREGDDEVWRRVGTYWGGLGLPYHGRSKVTLSNGRTVNPAWSAAFISWVVSEQGVGLNRFKGAQGHWRYVADLFELAFTDPLFEVKDPNGYAPQPGDLVHFGREWASQFDLAAAKEHVLIDGFYPSHSDFVLRVERGSGQLITVGGNVSSSVSQKRVGISNDGRLLPHEKNGSHYPWIAVLRLRL